VEAAAELGVVPPGVPGVPEEAVAAADAAAAGDEEEDAGEDVHPAIKAPKLTKAAATSGVVVRRSVISAIPLLATSRQASPHIPLGRHTIGCGWREIMSARRWG
jgi:hypothetical protein